MAEGMAEREQKRQRGAWDDVPFSEMIPRYYEWLFPAHDFVKWLSYGTSKHLPGCDTGFLQRRELAITTIGDVFIRYQSIEGLKDLEGILKNPEKLPARIELGPVYNIDPRKRSAYTGTTTGTQVFEPEERELIFDIDISDYDDVRTCCSNGNICLKCWQLMAAAIKVLDEGLRKDFGFQHILWVFSGRRGVHCWVCDERARKLTNEQRSAVAEYFAAFDPHSPSNDPQLGTPWHPSLSRAYDVLYKHWREARPSWKVMLQNGLEPLLNPDFAQRVEEIRAKFHSRRRPLPSGGDSEAKWVELENLENQRLLMEVIFTYCYPRIDINVSKQRNHLLKAPFCVHPKTGMVCVPIDPEGSRDFDPTQVPTIAGLLSELDSLPPLEKTDSNHQAWEGTSLAPYLRYFKESFLEPLLKEEEYKIRANAKKRQTADW